MLNVDALRRRDANQIETAKRDPRRAGAREGEHVAVGEAWIEIELTEAGMCEIADDG